MIRYARFVSVLLFALSIAAFIADEGPPWP